MVQEPPKKSKKGLIIGIVAGVLVLLIVIAALTPSPEKPFFGRWKADIDYTESAKGEFDEYAKYLDDDFSCVLSVDFTFNDDKTYKYSLNKDSFDKAKSMLESNMEKIMIKVVKEAAYNTLTESEINEAFENAYGMTVKEYVKDAMKDFTYESVNASLSGEGNFKVSDNKLFLSDGLDHNVDESTYDVFVKNSSTEIVLTEEYVKNIKSENADSIFPMTAR